jgi:hypothetical protein
MPEKLNLAIFFLHLANEKLILGVVAGVCVVHNTNSLARLSLIGHRGIHQTRVAAPDCAAVFAEDFGAFDDRGHTLRTLPAVKKYCPFEHCTI